MSKRKLFLPESVINKDLEAYFKDHTSQVPGWSGQHIVIKEMRVFKKARICNSNDYAVVNMKLTPGALVYTPPCAFSSYRPNDRKMRASQARVSSIARCSDGQAVGGAVGKNGFFYAANKLVRPEFEYDMNNIMCSSGIHFFLNVRDAYYYDFF